MLPTASVVTWGSEGTTCIARALLDSGAQGCLVSCNLVKRLGITVREYPHSIRGIGDTEVGSVKGVCRITLTSRVDSSVSLTVTALVMPNVMGSHPHVRLSPLVRQLVAGLSLADPDFDIPGPVDILLGVDALGHLLVPGVQMLQTTGLVSVNTRLGHVVMGPVMPASPRFATHGLLYGSVLSEVIQKFWEVEEPPTVRRLDPVEEECEQFYRNNTGRLRSGRFITRLPFRSDRPPLGSSHHAAETRLLSMERRMKRDGVFRQKYVNFMREYESLGHMSVSGIDWKREDHCFLPHHAVLRSPEGKIRVVFDGSASTSNGMNLNQCLHSGPKLNHDIADIITRFRRHNVVFVADIRMMFRQTVIHPDDRRYQLILWRESPDQPVRVYELNTNTYGLRSSPYLAIRTLRELADRERLNFPRGAAILEQDLYVDDICTGADTVEEALARRDELIELLHGGGYELRKWMSNAPEVLAGLPDDHQQDPHIFENLENPNMLSVLGIQYQPVSDVFTYRVELDSPKVWTKRNVLSTVARTFDPNGWITPVTFQLKCFMQQLWTAELKWDDPIGGSLSSEWESFFATLPGVNRISLPRRLVPTERYTATLHGFCDASEKGYGAAVYLRTVTSTGEVDVRLVMGKSKVAPLRTRMTIPKLELSGAALLTRLLNHTMTVLRGSIALSDTVYAWTDSQIVLCWLKASVHKLETFVANRVSQIVSSEVPLVWRHVPGEMNPADCASRGCHAPELVGHPLWWGPRWLTRAESDWPTSPRVISADGALRIGVCTERPEPEDEFSLLERYSSLDKLVNVTAWIFRFARNSRTPEAQRLRTRFLTPRERNHALFALVRNVQTVHFRSELDILRRGRVQLKGAVSRLNPFIDPQGLLRVGGRLRNANLPYATRHPLLLPKKGKLIELLVRDRHLRNGHVGCQALMAILQREFWILSGRRLVRSVVFRCLPCYRVKAATMQPQMGDLPSDRVNEIRPFAGVGTDFAGPFMVKTSRLRNAKLVKVYLCVFVCLATKAVHLEVVSDLTTEAFIACLDRFVSRRGLPSLIRSDNGTNFVGARRYLQEVTQFLNGNQDAIGTACSRRGIEWVFSPPGCPHWGGIFEAAVKSAKSHLTRIIGETSLSFEELTTLFCKIEMTLNSRPLCPLSSDPNDLEALTPGHLLIGQPLNALPEYPYGDVKLNRLTRWQMLQQMAQDFWKRWSLEYLHILQQRLKWTDRTSPPQVGDLVLIKDANLPSLRWRRGRIVNLFPGRDGTPRSAEVKVGDSVLKRAVATLSRLPID